MGDHDLLHCCTFVVEAANDAQNVSVDTADYDQPNDTVISQSVYITKSLQTSEETDRHAYKLTMDSLQFVLINVLIRSIFKHWVFTRECSNAFKGR